VPPPPLTHTPAAHDPLQALPQPPQFAVFVLTSTQASPHLVCPGAQTQEPLEQVCPDPQRVLQEPQFVASVIRLAQLVPQAISPPAQLAEHLLCEQNWPFVQTVPHMPQLLASETKFTHAVPHLV
jgi:hypothetical protein